MDEKTAISLYTFHVVFLQYKTAQRQPNDCLIVFELEICNCELSGTLVDEIFIDARGNLIRILAQATNGDVPTILSSMVHQIKYQKRWNNVIERDVGP